ncbi:LIC_10190 family membrane protein [Microseira sp. BLCC-F43]|uniref:LIC_10190 family membrane protein n=1 Tax=Microseira sp. BLCC-F43 TaxID=3153602 RepID=UPI0035B6E8C3
MMLIFAPQIGQYSRIFIHPQSPMLYFIFAWTLLIIACCSIGTALLNLLRADCFERVGDRFTISVWLGVVILAISLLATSLVFPLSPSVGGIIILSLILGSFLLQKTWNELFALISNLSPRLIFGYLISALGVAALTTRQVTWIDTGLYHYGAIKWLAQFGAVPGLALVHSNLGFTSSWFAFAAPWNADIFDSRVTAIANGFVFLIALLHFLICLAQTFTNQAQISDCFVVIYSGIILPFVATNNLMAVILVSPSPDLPILFFTLVIAWAILIISHPITLPLQEVKNILDAKTIPIILAAGAVTMKPTALPLLLISGIFYVVGKGLNFRRILMGVALTVLLLLPMFSFGIITSGCPVFPATFLCVDLPWSLTAKAAKGAAKGTHEWTSWYASQQPEKNSIFWLLWQWFNDAKLHQVMALLIIISIICSIYIVRSANHQNRGQLWLIALAASGITFLMFTAPFFRFALGYLIILPALSMAIYCRKKLGQIWHQIAERFTAYYQSRDFRKVFLGVTLSLATLTSILLFNKATQSQLLLPPQLPEGELLRKQVNGITYFSPKPGSLCWRSELPCGFKIEDYVKLRDPEQGIKAGFVRKNEN